MLTHVKIIEGRENDTGAGAGMTGRIFVVQSRIPTALLTTTSKQTWQIGANSQTGFLCNN